MTVFAKNQQTVANVLAQSDEIGVVIADEHGDQRQLQSIDKRGNICQKQERNIVENKDVKTTKSCPKWLEEQGHRDRSNKPKRRSIQIKMRGSVNTKTLVTAEDKKLSLCHWQPKLAKERQKQESVDSLVDKAGVGHKKENEVVNGITKYKTDSAADLEKKSE